MDGVAVVKRSISFDADVWADITRLAKPGEVSAFVNEAIRNALWRERGLAAVAEFEAENGSPTEEDLAKAAAVLDAAGVIDLNPRSR